MRKKKKQRRSRWIQGDELNKWVVCLSCGEEYFIESFELNPFCPVCESREYEESNGYRDFYWDGDY